MRYAIEIRPRADRDLQRLPRDTQARVRIAIDSLADNPFPPGVKKLKGIEGWYRIRIGDYRVLYDVQSSRLVVLVVRVGHRREVYRGLM